MNSSTSSIPPPPEYTASNTTYASHRPSLVTQISRMPDRLGSTLASSDVKKAVPMLQRPKTTNDFIYWVWNSTKKKSPDELSNVTPPKIGKLGLLKFSTRREKLYMSIGIVMACVTGCAMPAWLYLLAEALDKFSNIAILIETVGGEGLYDYLMKELNNLVIAFMIVGLISLVSGTTYVSLWTYTGEQQSLRIKKMYVAAAFRQDSAWFDENNPEELPTKVANAMLSVSQGVGRQMADCVMNLWSGVGCLVVALYLNTNLALVMLCCVPVVGLIVAILSIFVRKSSKKASQRFGSAGALATEVISGIKTVASLCAEKWAMEKYESHVRAAQEASVWGGFITSLTSGLTGFVFYLIYFGAFVIGTEQVVLTYESWCIPIPFLKPCAGPPNECIPFIHTCGTSGAEVMTTIYGVILSATFLGLMAPSLQAMTLAQQAAVDIFATIKRQPTIDAKSTDGLELDLKDNEKGVKLEFKDVIFSYPTRPSIPIFLKFNLTIEPGSSVALVGPSGSGKSTISRLLLRFYDPIAGSVMVNDVPIPHLNIAWWRQQVGYVAQEPVIFPGTIRENIAAGKPDATESEIIKAAKAACAHEFIQDMPDGYDTFFSGASISMSGGQMQRISIARAIVRHPSILLLDEATSALDTNSERSVQRALENIRSVRKITTVTVAHRLSTIVGCDKIAVISDGGVAECGDHTSLLRMGGIYTTLCHSQGIGEIKKKEEQYDENNGSITMTSPADSQEIEASLPPSSFDNDGIAPMELSPMEMESATAPLQEEPTTTTPPEKPLAEFEKEAEELASLSRLWKYNKSEWAYMILGVFGSLLLGALPPCEGILTAQIVANYYMVPAEDLRATNYKYSAFFAVLSGVSLLANIAMGVGFSVSGYRLTRRLRVVTFRSIVRRSMPWFDVPEHSVGELTTRLETDAEYVSKITGWSLGYRIRVVASLVSAVIICLLYSWQIGLLCMGCIPLIMGAAVIKAACTKRMKYRSDKLSPATILEQGLRGIVAVQAYGRQDAVCQDYSEALEPEVQGKVKEGMIQGFIFGYSQMAIFVSFALVFLVGSRLLVAVEIDFVQFFTSLLAVFFGAIGIAQINADFDAQRDGQAAAARIFALVDEPYDTNDPFGDDGKQPNHVDGRINFENVTFTYPTRPEHPVYYPAEGRKGFDLDIMPKESVAFVGKSGCGKSTALQIFLRFYDATSGRVTLDGVDIKELNVSWLRSCIGYVGQSPVLFDDTVLNNILLGKQDATPDDVVQAAKAANAHDFITKLSDGYDTNIGNGGMLLSGGQRQRLAIARAIIKKPKILVLDEATSALDNESERVVQAALDHLQLSQPRTMLTVAHRLVTVKDCTKIAVLNNGGVKELGPHSELVEREGGLYRELWKKQVTSEDDD